MYTPTESDYANDRNGSVSAGQLRSRRRRPHAVALTAKTAQRSRCLRGNSLSAVTASSEGERKRQAANWNEISGDRPTTRSGLEWASGTSVTTGVGPDLFESEAPRREDKQCRHDSER